MTMTNLLEQLKTMTTVVADTGDILSIEQFTPRDATTNPSLITAAAKMPEYQTIVDETLAKVRGELGADASEEAIISQAADQLAIAFGLKILAIIPGRISTEVDARLSYDTGATIKKARKVIAQYDAAGISRDRILIKIAATWEGIQAATVLEKEGIHCNLTLIFGSHQAIACAQHGITLISPFVGRILDWYKKESGRDAYPAAEDPGVLSVTEIYHYFKKFGFKTEVMGASFRNSGEILELAGVDLLTISPALLDELKNTVQPLERKLSIDKSQAMTIEEITVDKSTFDRMHSENRMATEKLSEGINSFIDAQKTLEEQLSERVNALWA
jgi:transaldolase